MRKSRFGKTKEEILSRVGTIKNLQETQSNAELGLSEMELDLLYIEFKDIVKPGWDNVSNIIWDKHPW